MTKKGFKKISDFLNLTALKKGLYLFAILSIISPAILSFFQLNRVNAQIPPVLQADLQARNLTAGSGFGDFTIAQAGQRLEVQVIVLNPNGSQTATGITAKVNIPSGTITTSDLNLSVTASNAAPVGNNTTIQVFNPGGGLFYVPGSTRVSWDTSGDGIHEFLNTVWQDGIAGGGLVMGNVLGFGNTTKIRLTFYVDVLAPGQEPPNIPTPTPTPTPPSNGGTTPTPTQPPPGGSTQSGSQSQTTTVNPQITNTNTFNPNIVIAKDGAETKQATSSGQVLGAKDLPKTGPTAIVMAGTALFAFILFGLWFRKFGDLPIKRFGQLYAIKVSRGENLTNNQFVQNRLEIKKFAKG